jgi:peptide/nickel transport system substrate-binding protein
VHVTGTEHREDGWDRSLSRRRLLAGAAAAAAAGAFPFALDAESAFAATKPRKGGRLRVAINDGGSTDLLTPYNLPNWASAARAEAAYERLFKVDPFGVPQPRLALSLEPNKTGTVWRCKLRQGVTFHSGKKFTAEDVLYSYRYIANPKNKAEGQPRVSQIDLANSKAISPYEIEFRLKAPIGDFASTVSDKAIWIAPTGKTDFGTKPDGTGPFQFVQWQPGVNSLYKRFEHYWGLANGGGPYVDELEFQTIVDDSARLNALLGGQVDEMVFISFLQAKNQASSKAIKVIKADQANCSPITMQIDSKLFKSNDVRVAMKLALDREQLIKNVTLGFGTVGNDLFGKGLPSYNSSLPQRTYDPQKAASLLKKAGVGKLDLTLPTSNAYPGMLEGAVAFESSSKKAGINVTIKRIPAGTYFANDQYLKTPFYQTFWGQGFESQAQDGLLKNSPYNETDWFDPKWDAAFRKAQGIVDRAARLKAYKALQVPLWEKGGYMIWGFFPTLDAVSSKVNGVVPNRSSGYQNLGGFEFKDHWLSG